MTSEQRKRIASLFDAARAQPPEGRVPFVAGATADDDDEVVRREVQALLDRHAADNAAAGARNAVEFVAAVVDPAIPDDHLIGRVVGDYRFDRRLGKGGMGVVYQAHDTKLGRDVAVKVLPALWALNPDRLTRFKREARVLASLNHPHIAGIYGTLEAEGIHGIVLELAVGATLADRLANSAARGRQGLPLQYALTVARQIALALDAAHEKGIVHRDLKPANVVLQGEVHVGPREGQHAGSGPASDVLVKVLDFGIAKLTGEVEAADASSDSTVTATTRYGALIGTPSYMSPEQARGQQVDKRTDTWAFGCVLFEMLTGRLAFHGDTGQDALAAVLERDVSWTDLPRHTPAAIRTLLRRCLEKDPARRLRDIGDARLEIEDVLAGTVESSSLNPNARTEPERVRPRWPLMAFAGLFGVVALVFGVLAWQESGVPESFETVSNSRPFLTSANDEFGSRISPDGQWLSFATTVGDETHLQVRHVQSGEAGQVRIPAGKLLSQIWSPDGHQLAYLQRQAEGAVLQVVPAFFGGTPLHSVVIRPLPVNARLLRWIDRMIYLQLNDARGRSLWRVNLADGSSLNVSRTWRVPGLLRGFDVTPDGRRAAYTVLDGGRENLWIATIDGTSPKQLTNDASFERFPLWSGPTSIIYQSNRGGQIDLWEIDTESHRSRVLTSSATVEEPESTSTDGALISFSQVSDEAHLWTWNTVAGTSRQLTDDALTDFSPTADAAGGLIVFQRTKPSPVVGDPLDSTLFLSLMPQAGFRLAPEKIAEGFAPLLSPDGTWLAYLQRQPSQRAATLFLRHLQTHQTIPLTSSAPPPAYSAIPLEWAAPTMAWNPTSTELFLVEGSGDWGVRRYRVAGGPAEGPIARGTKGEAYDLRPSPDGRTMAYVVFSDGQSTIRLFDLTSGAERVAAVLPGKVYVRGWVAGSKDIVVVRSTAVHDDYTADIEVIVRAVNDPNSRRIAQIGRAFPATTHFDGNRGILYLTRVEGGIHNLHAVSIATGRVRRLTENNTAGVTFSGVEPLDAASFVGVRAERNSDIWLFDRGIGSVERDTNRTP